MPPHGIARSIYYLYGRAAYYTDKLCRKRQAQRQKDARDRIRHTFPGLNT